MLCVCGCHFVFCYSVIVVDCLKLRCFLLLIGLRDVNIFVVLVYVKAWFTATSAPYLQGKGQSWRLQKLQGHITRINTTFTLLQIMNINTGLTWLPVNFGFVIMVYSVLPTAVNEMKRLLVAAGDKQGDQRQKDRGPQSDFTSPPRQPLQPRPCQTSDPRPTTSSSPPQEQSDSHSERNAVCKFCCEFS